MTGAIVVATDEEVILGEFVVKCKLDVVTIIAVEVTVIGVGGVVARTV